MFGCNNDRLFPEKYKVKDYISNTKLEKGDHYYIQTRYKDPFFPLQSYSVLKLLETHLKLILSVVRNEPMQIDNAHIIVTIVCIS